MLAAEPSSAGHNGLVGQFSNCFYFLHITSHGRWNLGKSRYSGHAPEEGRPATGSCRHPGGNDSHQGAAQVLLLALAVGARTSRSRNLRRVYHIDFRPLADKEESSELQQLFP